MLDPYPITTVIYQSKQPIQLNLDSVPTVMNPQANVADLTSTLGNFTNRSQSNKRYNLIPSPVHRLLGYTPVMRNLSFQKNHKDFSPRKTT